MRDLGPETSRYRSRKMPHFQLFTRKMQGRRRGCHVLFYCVREYK